MSDTATARRRRAHRHGHRAEALAALMLRLKFYRILARRFRTPLGEVDIIARRGKLVAVVEVKARASLAGAVDAVSIPAWRRIEAASDIFMARQPAGLSVRYDIVAIVPGRLPRHLQGAWQARS